MISYRVCLGIGVVAASLVGPARAQAPTQATTRPEINAPMPATPDEIIAFRRSNYKWMGDTFEEMKKAIASSADVTPFAPKAADMVAWAHRIPAVFPAGTETGRDNQGAAGGVVQPRGLRAARRRTGHGGRQALDGRRQRRQGRVRRPIQSHRRRLWRVPPRFPRAVMRS